MRNVAKAVDLKPSSIYSHFPNGRDEIVTEAFRWSYHSWGVELLEEIDKSENASDLWDKLIDVHVRRQLTIPYHDIWDMLWGMDRISEFLPSECREELRAWLEMLYELMSAAIVDMGFVYNEQSVRLVISILDGVTSWCRWSGREEDLAYHVRTANAITRLILERPDVFEAHPQMALAEAINLQSSKESGLFGHRLGKPHRLPVSPKIGV